MASVLIAPLPLFDHAVLASPAEPSPGITVAGQAGQIPGAPTPGQTPLGPLPGAQPPPGPPRPDAKAPDAKAKTPTGPPPFFPVVPAWTADLGAAPSAQPAFDAEQAYVPLQSGKVAAVALDTGEVKWSQLANTSVAPSADEGRVFIVGESELTALATTDGHTLWRVPLTGHALRRPAARGGWVVVTLESGDLVALRAEDGKPVWTVPQDSASTIDPFIEGDRLFVSSTRGLVALDLVSGKKQWERPLDGRATAVARAGDAIYIGTAGRWFYSVDVDTGRVRWRWRVAGEPVGVVADDALAIVLMLDHTIRAFKVGNGAQAWREALVYRPFAGPVRAPAQLLVAGHGAVVRAYSASDGKPAGQYTMPAAATADSPEQLDALGAVPHVRLGGTIIDDLLVLVTQRGTVHGAGRQLGPVLTPLTQMPGTPVTVPGPPPAAPASLLP